jgi:hypothetical protein
VRAVSVFANLSYLPSLAALLNSILHFRVQAKIKVYDFSGFPHMAKSHLAGYATVVAPSGAVFGDRYLTHWNYRPRMLVENLDPYELQVDADTVVLSDLEPAFREIERGNLVVLREWNYDHCVNDAKGRDQRDRELPPDSVFHRLLRYPEIHRQGLPIYNAGLLGVHRQNHRMVIDLWAQATRDYDRIAGTFFWVDQNKLSLIVASLLKDGKITVHELPKHLWMQTWDDHQEPKKFLSFEEGRIALYNGSPANRMHFYHYTGDVTAPGEIAGEAGKYPVRFNAFMNDLDVPAGLTQRQMMDSWNYVWRVRHGSPVGELPIYFYNLGPVRSPKCLDPAWRELIAKLVGPNVGKDSRETWAVAFAYDYIDYCGYRGVDLGWMSDVLKILFGEQRLNIGDKAVSWQVAADVAISFQAGHEKQRPWTEAETPEQHGFRCGYTECHRGVFLNIRSGVSDD